MESIKEKSPKESELVTYQLTMPAHSNPTWRNDSVELGSVNGGAILNLIDNVAGLVALRHARTRAVTASIDRMSFLNPVHVGELLILKARVNYVGTKSMEIGVRVETENMESGMRKQTGSAYLTFVTINTDGHPINVPFKLKLETEDDKRRFSEAKKRIELRKQQRLIEIDEEKKLE